MVCRLLLWGVLRSGRMRDDISRLCYIDAGHVESGGATLNGVDVRDATGKSVGTLDGLIIDPPAGRLCYFVLEAPAWFTGRRYLLPICSARLDRGNHALHVEVDLDPHMRRPEFDSEAFRAFSEEDVISALFPRRAAAG